MDRHPTDNRDSFAIILRLVYSGALAIAVVAVTQLLGRDPDELDPALSISIYCFAISMPLMAVGILLLTAETFPHRLKLSSLTGFVLVVGSIVGFFASLAGMFFLFWHFHPGAAVTFTFTTAVAYGAWLRRHRARR
jgi:hypothetical protein